MKTEKADLTFLQSGHSFTLKCEGDWRISTVAPMEKSLKKALPRMLLATEVIWDFSDAGLFDSAGMTLIIAFEERLDKAGVKVTRTGMHPEHQKIYRLLRENIAPLPAEEKRTDRLLRAIENLGKNSIAIFRDFLDFFAFLGEATVQLFYYMRHPSSIRYKAIIKYIHTSAIDALGIIALTAFLIGVVIAYQSAVQLQKFGASIFIVDMIGISITRELAPLITAIVVAGRSGSSYTAQLGVMKLTEEIDAMRTMGFEPYRFLVLPRIIALMIAMPLLIFFADVVGIFGGMVVANAQLNISFDSFIEHLQGALAIKHFWVGLFKGPFFAWLIAAIGCFRGLQVSRDTESIGEQTTLSVVNAIFLVIACDALFSVILTELEI